MAKGEARETEYAIFHSTTGRSWAVVGALASKGGQSGAIRKFTEKMTETDGFWAAVPTRSWQPGQIAPEVVRTNRFVPIDLKGGVGEPVGDPDPDPVPAAA